MPGSVSVEFVPERPVVAYDVCWQRAVAEMKRLAPVAAEHQIHIGVENVWNKFLLSPLEMRAFIDEIGSEWIGSYFDVGNVVYAGYPEQWIRILGKPPQKGPPKASAPSPGGPPSLVDLRRGGVGGPGGGRACGPPGRGGRGGGPPPPPDGHASDQIIYNTAASMGRILEKKF